MIKKSLIFIFVMFGVVIGLTNNVNAQTNTTVARFFLNNNSWTVEGTEGSNFYTVLDDIEAGAVLDVRIEWQEIWYDDIATYELGPNNNFVVIIEWLEYGNNFKAEYFISSDGSYYLSYLAESYEYMPPIYITFLGEIELGYDEGYDEGYRKGLNDGKKQGRDEGYYDGFDDGKIIGFDEGYRKGIDENVETGGFGMLLASAFVAVGALLSIQLLPNITIGALVAIPVVFGVVMFIIGRRKE